MKKKVVELKRLTLTKSVISSLSSRNVMGGGHTFDAICNSLLEGCPSNNGQACVITEGCGGATAADVTCSPGCNPTISKQPGAGCTPTSCCSGTVVTDH